jgi:hypothetical protein
METFLNMSYELLALFIFHTLGISIFGKFEMESPWWRHTMKWIVIFLLIFCVYYYFGHTIALLTILFLAISGTSFHIWWCLKNQIHPVNATPRKRYYELRGWKWLE